MPSKFHLYEMYIYLILRYYYFFRSRGDVSVEKRVDLNLRKRMFLLAFIIVFTSLFIRLGVAKAAPYIERVSGSNRIETAIQISQTGWETAENVIVARADNPADALSSASLSGSIDAPILLTDPNTLQQNVIDEIRRLNAKNIYILGGTGAVSGRVELSLKSLGKVKRLGGPTRFETASIINNEAKTSLNTKAIVVSGYAAADALSAASNSANNRIPIYLSTKTTIPVNLPANVKEVTIYGGIGVVGSEVESLLTKKGIKVNRISGIDRYETNIKAADESLKDNVIIVRGTSTNSKTEDYPDAVAGAGLSHKLDANIILSDPTVTIPVTVNYFDNHRYTNVYVLGGVGAVSEDVVDSYTSLPDSKINKIFDFTPVAADEDPSKPVIYMLNDNDNTINSYNYETKELKSLKLSGKPEELYVRNNKIFVTIVDKPHSSYWDNNQQTGGIDIVDGENFQLIKIIPINIDPFDIVVDSNGVMYISSGSGQLTYIKSYSSETGTELSSLGIRQQSYLEMNPNQTKIYSIETDSTPSEITQYSLQDGKLVSSRVSTLNGDYELGGPLKMSPDGQYLFNNARNVFDGNLNYVASIENPYNDITFNLDHNRFFTGIENVIMEHNYSTLEITKYYLTNGQVMQTYYKNGKVIILSLITIGDATGLKKYSLETLDVRANN